MYTYVHVRVFVCLYVYTYVHVRVFVCVYVDMCVMTLESVYRVVSVCVSVRIRILLTYHYKIAYSGYVRPTTTPMDLTGILAPVYNCIVCTYVRMYVHELCSVVHIHAH